MINRRLVALSDVATIASGGGAPQDQGAFAEVGTPFVRAGSLAGLCGGASESALERLSDMAVRSFRLRVFPRGTVLFAKSGMSATKGLVYRLREPACVVNHLAAIVCNPDLDSEYLTHWLRVFSPTRLVRDAAYPSIRLSDVATLRMDLPHISEQRRIADLLNRADALVALRRSALAEVETLQQGMFIELFGDPLRNPMHWPLHGLQEVISLPLRNGLSPSRSGTVAAKVLTLSAITGKGFDADAWKTGTFLARPPVNSSVHQDDFLICRGNGNAALVGRGCFSDGPMPDMTFPDTIIAARVSTERIGPEFLQHVWNSDAVRTQVDALARTTNGTFKVNQGALEAIRFIAPPIGTQREFGERVAAMKRIAAAHRTSLSHLRELFVALQQQNLPVASQSHV